MNHYFNDPPIKKYILRLFKGTQQNNWHCPFNAIHRCLEIFKDYTFTLGVLHMDSWAFLSASYLKSIIEVKLGSRKHTWIQNKIPVNSEHSKCSIIHVIP